MQNIAGVQPTHNRSRGAGEAGVEGIAVDNAVENLQINLLLGRTWSTALMKKYVSRIQEATAARLVVYHSIVSFSPARNEVFARQPNSCAALEVSSERRG